MDGDFDFGYPRRQKTSSPSYPLEPASGGFMGRKPSLQRTRTLMENEGSSSPNWPPVHNHNPFTALPESNTSSTINTPSHPRVSGLHLPRLSDMPPPPRRFPGDGFDYRRPVTLTREPSEPDVIDLTAEEGAPSASGSRASGTGMRRPPQRPPRFSRDIMDVIDLEDEDTPQGPTSAASPESPEIQFVSSRRIDPPQNPGAGEDEIEITGSNTIAPRQRPTGWDAAIQMVRSMGGYPELYRHLEHAVNHGGPVAPPRNRHRRPVHRGQRAAGRIQVGFVAPTMNFELVGFDIGSGGRAPPPPPPHYNAPEPAPAGFTRSPEEEGDSLACPNCDNELCVGETELQRQVWIVKSCGHVYCGECTANRFSSKKNDKGKAKVAPAKHKPFKECAVEGCNKKTSNAKSMIQVFL